MRFLLADAGLMKDVRHVSCVADMGMYVYSKVASSNTSCLEAHTGFFQIVYEGDFRSLCTVTF